MVEAIGIGLTEKQHYLHFSRVVDDLSAGNLETNTQVILDYLLNHEGQLVSFVHTYNSSFPKNDRFHQGTIVGIELSTGRLEIEAITKYVPPEHKLYMTMGELRLFRDYRLAKITNPNGEIKFVQKKTK